MARLVSYKVKDDNRYSTFHNDIRYSSNENLQIHQPFKRMESATTKKSIKASTKKKKHCLLYTFQRICCFKLWQRFCACCCYCCSCKPTGKHRRKCCCCFCCGGESKFTNREQSTVQLNEINSTPSARYRPTVQTITVNVPQQPLPPPPANAMNSLKKSKRKYWNWNDSLRSNSDRFLETLEYDMEGERSLKRNYGKRPVASYLQGITFFFVR